ncbi:MAG: tetratricopeptide repeat protein, partial [Terriglobales bacterium]
CAVIFLLAATPAQGQKKGASPPPIASAPVPMQSPSTLDQTNVLYSNNESSALPKNPTGNNCFLPPLNGLQAGTVEVADLQVPVKTQMEYADGCTALRKKKIADAERHLRKAVKQDANYPAAWVLLGQVLQKQQRIEEAQDACSRPLTVSSHYLPAYLCLTDISARSENWPNVLRLSTRALEIDPTADPAAYAYNAEANLHLHHLPEAEKSALKATAIDRNNTDPRLHFLLAQIYAAKGDRPEATVQLREYLKFATDPEDVAMVQKYLSQLESDQAK